MPMMIIVYLLFLVIPALVAIILPLLISIWIAKRIFGKGISWKNLTAFIFSVLFLSSLVNIIWNYFIVNKIYYEWDRILYTPFTLVLHESPLLDGSASWIAPGWSITYLHLLFVVLLILVYSLSFLTSYIWFLRTKKRNTNEKTLYAKVLGLSIAILLILPLLWYKGSPLIFNALSNRFNPPLQRMEKFTTCIPPKEKNRVYYGGDRADYISSNDGSIEKIWDKPYASGIASGLPSPDKSKLLQFSDNDIWVKCTEGNGQYKIPIGKKTISSLPETDIYVNSITWSPDSTYVAFNYGGDLIKVNTVTKEKTVIYPNVAFKDYGIDPSKPRPSGWSGSYYTQGSVYWGKDGSLYYTKFLKDDKVELRRLDTSGNDTLILTSQYPLTVSNETRDQKLLIYESDWSTPTHKSSHYEGYVYDSKTGKKENKFLGYDISHSKTFYSYKVSDDGRYLLTNTGYTGQLSPAPVFWLFDLSNNQQIDVQEKIQIYLKKHGVTDATERIALIDIAPNNDLLFYIYFDNTHPSMTITSDINGNNIKQIFKDDKSSNKNPGWLIPQSWL